jgi:hypothetical protein
MLRGSTTGRLDLLMTGFDPTATLASKICCDAQQVPLARSEVREGNAIRRREFITLIDGTAATSLWPPPDPRLSTLILRYAPGPASFVPCQFLATTWPSFSGYLANGGAGKQTSPVPLLAPRGLVSLCERGPAIPLPLFCQDHVFHRRSLRCAHPQMNRRRLGRVGRHPLSTLRRR